MAKKKIVIVGGGFAGVKTALDLANVSGLDITLISDRPDFRYYPTLYHTATGGAKRQSSIPLNKIFAGKNIKLVEAEATKVNQPDHLITTVDNKTFDYDFLVLALGVVTNYFGIKGLKEYSFGIKSVEQAEALKKHLHSQLTADHQPDLNYVIIGGGPTGIELAGALPDYLNRLMKNHGIRHRAIHIDLVEAKPHLLPSMPRSVSRAVAAHLHKLGIKLYLGKSVQGETADGLMVDDRPISSHSVIWTAGVTNHPFFKTNGFELTDHGKVSVDPYLQASPDVFVLGDNANTPYSGLAQTALYDAGFVASNLIRHLNGKSPKVYKPKPPIYVIPAGSHWASVLWGPLHFYGWPGWILREVADFVAFHDLESLLPASEQWLSEFTEQEDCPECAKAVL